MIIMISLELTLKLVNASDYYVYDDEFSCVERTSRIISNMSKILSKMVKDLKVVGVVQPKEGQDSLCGQRGWISGFSAGPCD